MPIATEIQRCKDAVAQDKGRDPAYGQPGRFEMLVKERAFVANNHGLEVMARL
jgi:hypothetical protein